jgi:hypothetical protein
METWQTLTSSAAFFGLQAQKLPQVRFFLNCKLSCVVSVFTVTAAGGLLRLFFNASVNGLKTKIFIELLLHIKLILSRQEIFSFSAIS